MAVVFVFTGITVPLGISSMGLAGKKKYQWITLVPMSFVLVTTTAGAWELVTQTFIPWLRSADPASVTRGAIDILLTGLLFACLLILGIQTFKKLSSESVKREVLDT